MQKLTELWKLINETEPGEMSFWRQLTLVVLVVGPLGYFMAVGVFCL